MQRQRDGLVPAAEVLSGLAWPVKALAKPSPQALHHFTLADQVRERKRKSRLRLQRC